MAVWRRRERRNVIAPGAAAWAGLLLALAALSGCSGTGAAAERDAREAVRRAADLLVESGSSRAHTAMQMASGGTRITLHGQGGFDYGAGTGELRLTLPEGRRVTEVFLPGLLYMKDRGAGVPAGKWLRIEIAGLPDGNLVTGGATDPITAAELLRGVVTASELGEATIEGETLRHVRGVTDIGAAAEAAPGARARAQLTAAVDGFTRTQVPFDAYLDDQGLLRRVRHQFSFAGGEGARGIEVASTVVLYDFGTPVEIALPRDGDVYAGAVA
jgi:hypothetical protein